jgi:hypothetical protein
MQPISKRIMKDLKHLENVGYFNSLCSIFNKATCTQNCRLTQLFIEDVIYCGDMVPKIAGSNPAEAIGIFGRQNPQHAFLNLTGHFSPILPPFANRGLSHHLTWSASGDKRGTKTGFSTKSLERLKCSRRDSARPTDRRRTISFGTKSVTYFKKRQLLIDLVRYLPASHLGGTISIQN